MTTLWSRLMTGLTAFREGFLSADIENQENFSAFDSRRIRYDFYWALYENTAYRNIHKWAQAYKTTYGLYRYIRNIYNPSYRIGEFWKAHLMGGPLDPAAGDGSLIPTALPIITDYDNLRPAIANLWRWSSWSIKKDVFCLWGAILGDACIKIIDDPIKEKVYLKLVNPSTLKDIILDPFGNVKGYTIEETRDDPRNVTGQKVTYVETAIKDGDNIVYRTDLNKTPYPWNGEVAEWTEPYGFVPMVITQHNNVGLDWGWSELHPALSKFREVDDLASKLSDQIRKTVDAVWFFPGVDKSKTGKTTVPTDDPTYDKPMPGREEVQALYGPMGSTAVPLVAPIDIEATSEYILEILNDIERDFPEIDDSIVKAKAEISGRALRISREPIEVKVIQRRANYDDALVKAQQMGISIGGYRGYTGFEGYGLDSYSAGLLEHFIGIRPIFSKDVVDEMETEQLFWKIANTAKLAGMSLPIWLARQGWTKEEIDAVVAAPEYQANLANMQQMALLGDTVAPTDSVVKDILVGETGETAV